MPEVIDVLREDAHRAAMGRAGLAAVRDRSWPAICEQLVGHYRAVIAAQGGLTDGMRLAG